MAIHSALYLDPFLHWSITVPNQHLEAFRTSLECNTAILRNHQVPRSLLIQIISLAGSTISPFTMCLGRQLRNPKTTITSTYSNANHNFNVSPNTVKWIAIHLQVTKPATIGVGFKCKKVNIQPWQCQHTASSISSSSHH